MHKDGLLPILNGYGRIIEFSTSQIDKRGNYNPLIDSSKNNILSITEGHFKYGQLSGFGRVLDNDGQCQVGFWRLNEATTTSKSRPWGKFAHYYKDGGFKKPEGIYLQEVTKVKTIKSYMVNEAPSQWIVEDDKYQKRQQSTLRTQNCVYQKKPRTIYMI